MVEVVARFWTEYTANKETDGIIKKKLMVILFSPFPQRPFSNRTTQAKIFFFWIVDVQTFFSFLSYFFPARLPSRLFYFLLFLKNLSPTEQPRPGIFFWIVDVQPIFHSFPILFFPSRLASSWVKTKQKIFILLQCCTKMNISLNSKVEPNYLLSTHSGKLIDLMIPFYLTT